MPWHGTIERFFHDWWTSFWHNVLVWGSVALVLGIAIRVGRAWRDKDKHKR